MKKTGREICQCDSHQELVYKGEVDKIRPISGRILSDSPECHWTRVCPCWPGFFQPLTYHQHQRLNIKAGGNLLNWIMGWKEEGTRRPTHTADFKNLVQKIKTRAYTWTRIQRNLLHIFFNLQGGGFPAPGRMRALVYPCTWYPEKERTDLLNVNWMKMPACQ